MNYKLQHRQQQEFAKADLQHIVQVVPAALHIFVVECKVSVLVLVLMLLNACCELARIITALSVLSFS